MEQEGNQEAIHSYFSAHTQGHSEPEQHVLCSFFHILKVIAKSQSYSKEAQ